MKSGTVIKKREMRLINLQQCFSAAIHESIIAYKNFTLTLMTKIDDITSNKCI